jgi:hypothetical protein
VDDFHNRILGFYRAPIVTGRIIDLKTEVMPRIQAELKKTFFKQGLCKTVIFNPLSFV